MLKIIILPRQARDKHRENSKKSTDFFAQDYYSETPHGNLHLAGQADDHPGAKTPFGVLSHFYRNGHFAKTGSEQT
jgi:hypothetical protein